MSAGSSEFIRRHRWACLAAVAILAAATWFLWPIAGGGSGDVAAVGDDTFMPVSPALGRQLRDRGRGLVEMTPAQDWCALADGLPASDLADVDLLVIGVAERGDCAGDPVRAVLGELDDRGIEPVVVVLPGELTPTSDVRLVLTETLLGPPGELTMPCEWWDDCLPEGAVQVRSAGGDLTDIGTDRVARMIAAAIG